MTVVTTMFKRLRFVFWTHRFFPAFGKILRYDIHYDCSDGLTVVPSSDHSTQAAKHPTEVVFVNISYILNVDRLPLYLLVHTCTCLVLEES